VDLREHWDGIYHKLGPGSLSWYEAEPTTLDLVVAAAPGRDASILDVGGGAPLLVDRLLDRGYTHLAVADVSEAALDAARARLGARAEQVRWLAQDVRELEACFAVDVWHDRAVFHFLTAAVDRDRYRDRMLATLRPGGHVVLSTFALDGPPKCNGLDVVRYDVAQLAKMLGPELRLVDSRARAHTTPAGREQRFIQVLLRRRGPDEPPARGGASAP